MLRAALYARFSTELQSDASVEDQLRLCRELAAARGYMVIAEFQDAAISGYAIGSRPGVQALLALALSGGCDAVIAEHTDRLARRGSAGSQIFEDLEARGVTYLTVHEGEVDEVKQNISNLVSGLKLKEVRHRTRRGLEGVVLSGRSAGGCAYGYNVPRAYDAAGERLRGLREVDETEAATVRRIYRAFASGASPLALADALNREGVPAPRGTHWLASTIIGNRQRGVGILRNELYRGVRVWGRLTMIKDRVSGKRRTAMGTGLVQRVETPELRIIDDDLWARVQSRLEATSAAVVGSGHRRPLHLLSGLIRCGSCGGAMTSAGTGDYLRCSGRSNRGGGSCANTRNPAYARIERVVLAGIEANLLHPAAVAASMEAFRQRIAEDRKSQAGRRTPLERELADVTRRADRLIREVEDGMPWAAVKDRHAQLASRQAHLREALAQASEGADVVRLHTSSAAAYRAFVASLRAELPGADAGPAREAVRSLVESVRFLPLERKGAFELEIAADLEPILIRNETGPGLVRADATWSRFTPRHEFIVRFKLAG